MTTNATRTAIDIGPSETRPWLVLLCGILAVPGSTVAWELPAGGLWIGLPLGIAAIVLGIRARRAGAGGAMVTVGIVLAALSILQMAVWTVASAVSRRPDEG
jgi:hypothetical protein